jgi:hypothetical protein
MFVFVDMLTETAYNKIYCNVLRWSEVKYSKGCEFIQYMFEYIQN